MNFPSKTEIVENLQNKFLQLTIQGNGKYRKDIFQMYFFFGYLQAAVESCKLRI